jgi:hypothetical protein
MVAVLPVADPNIFSSAQRITLAQTQLQMAQSAPQMHDMYEAYYRVYAALNVRDIDGILLPQNTQMPKDPASENSDVLNNMRLKAFAGQQHDAHIAGHLMMGLSPILQANPMSATSFSRRSAVRIRMPSKRALRRRTRGTTRFGGGLPYRGRHAWASSRPPGTRPIAARQLAGGDPGRGGRDA